MPPPRPRSRATYLDGAVGPSGQYVIQAEVVQYTETAGGFGASSGQAGIILRNDMAGADALPGVVLYVDTTGTIGLARNSAGGTVVDSSSGGMGPPGMGGASVGYPVWLRLVRNGTSVSGWYSTDGTNWTQQGSTITLAAAAEGARLACPLSRLHATIGPCGAGHTRRVGDAPFGLSPHLFSPAPELLMKCSLALHAAFPLLAILSACGGGGGGSTVSAPSVSITSPTNSARIIGSSSVTVTGTVQGDGVSVTVSNNGGTAVAATVSGTSFSAVITLDPKDNAIVATATNSAGTATATASVYFPFLSLTTFQDASVVIGASDFTSVGSFDSLYGSAGWDGNQLYLPDYGAANVQVLAGFPTANGSSPSFTLTKVNAGTAAESSLTGPQTIRVSGGKLFLDDYDDSRVLIFDSFPSADGAAASVAVGQPDLTSTSSGCTAAGLKGPESTFVVGTKLIVADSQNNRVLVWNTIPTSSGQPADLVLGQAGFTSCDRDAGAVAVSASGFGYPTDAWSDGTRLFVVDAGNDRVLGWNTFPTANGQAADFVLGQADLTSDDEGTAQGLFSYPYFIDSNGNQLFVTDFNNSRVLVWNALPSATGALPDVVLGQGDFDHGLQNDADQDGVTDAMPSAKALGHPDGLLVLDDALVVADRNNDRFVVFR